MNTIYEIKWVNGDGGPMAGSSIRIEAQDDQDAISKFKQWRKDNPPSNGWRRSGRVTKTVDKQETMLSWY